MAVFFTIIVTVLMIVPPRIFGEAIDEALTPITMVEEDIEGLDEEALDYDESVAMAREERQDLVDRAPLILMYFGIALAVVVTLRSILNYTLAVQMATIGHRFCFDLRFATWRHLQRLSLAYHKQTQTGKIMARATGDIDLIQQLIQGQLVNFIGDLIGVVAVIVILFFLEWRIAVIILGLVPLYVVAYMLYLKRIRDIRVEQRRLWDKMVGFLAEKVAAIAVVKAFVREKRETSSFMDVVKQKFSTDRQQLHTNRQLGLISSVISALGTGIVYSYGGYLVVQDQMTIGELVSITMYIGFVFQPAVRVVDFNASLQWAIAAMDRVFETLDRQPEIEDEPDSKLLPAFSNQIVIDNVKFVYSDGQVGIDGVTLKVKKGEIIGVVGQSGSGKTTLMNLLMRFYDPSSGRITIDGMDLRDIKMDSLRKQVSMVAQENVVFSVSIKENVRYGSRDATDEDIVRACKAADLHDFVMTLENGYETRIGEDGIKFSGGQRQRLALARALVTDPSILILDDVTSALDGETEAKVQEALRRVMQDRTTFIVAHRLSSVVESDRIVVMSDGKIVDVGTHQELYDRGGIYRDMFEEQFRSALEATS
jgi:subfamily B ATP-binding cassette protein MsbA